jgi:Do/DeqQ family serine protease
MKEITMKVRGWTTVTLLIVALVIGAGTWVFVTAHHSPLAVTHAAEPRGISNVASAPIVVSEGFSTVVEPLLPAVVNISSSKIVKSRRGQFQFPDDPFFRQFFGSPFEDLQPREQREHSLGSGVIVSPDGYVLTNNHVVDEASDVEVSLKDKRQFKAKIVGTDPRTDIAVLKIPATGLSTVPLGSSSKVHVGDIVLAIGDPFGIGETVTMGIVSATGRRALDIEGPGGYEDFIQTDAAINPGNSGGALVNARGELIGINTAIISNGGGGNQGIGFAVPVDMARQVMDQIVKTGKVRRGYLGVMIQEVTPDLAKAFGLSSAGGALVGDVTADSPGAKAGLQKGDVIVAMNGQPISDFQDLRLRISQSAPGETVKLQVVRNGNKRELTATLGELPNEAATASSPERGENALEGIQVETLTPEIARQFDLPAATRGVVVTEVNPGSAAAEAGLTRGDVIQEVNRKPVSNVSEFRTAVRAAGNEPVLLLINRSGTTSYVLISPQ